MQLRKARGPIGKQEDPKHGEAGIEGCIIQGKRLPAALVQGQAPPLLRGGSGPPLPQHGRRVDEGRPVRFFGREKQTTLLPAKLALRFDCELVPVQVIRGKDARFRVYSTPR